jgi:hypothetical protein
MAKVSSVEQCECVYHSDEWMILVESGWITMTVDGNIARMIRW